MRSILLTGGTGAFGQAFTERLLSNGLASRICIFSRGEFKQAQMRRRFSDDARLRFMVGDVRDRWRLLEAARGCDTIIHAAALKRIEVGHENPEEMFKTNQGGAMNVKFVAFQAGVERVVFLSTDKAFQPVSPYGNSKQAAEFIFRAANDHRHPHDPKFAICRYGNIFRSTGSVVPTWEQAIEDGQKQVLITDPEVTRFFMSMDEAINLVLKTVSEMPDDVTIPTLPAYRLGDLAEAMGVNAVPIGLGQFEKRHESMCEGNCSETARRMSIEELRECLR